MITETFIDVINNTTYEAKLCKENIICIVHSPSESRQYVNTHNIGRYVNYPLEYEIVFECKGGYVWSYKAFLKEQMPLPHEIKWDGILDNIGEEFSIGKNSFRISHIFYNRELHMEYGG